MPVQAEVEEAWAARGAALRASAAASAEAAAAADARMAGARARATAQAAEREQRDASLKVAALHLRAFQPFTYKLLTGLPVK